MSVTVSQAIAAFQANPTVAPMTILDVSTNIPTNLDALQTIAAANRIVSISITDPGMNIGGRIPGARLIAITYSQFVADQTAIGLMLNPVNPTYGNDAFEFLVTSVPLANITAVRAGSYVALFGLQDIASNLLLPANASVVSAAYAVTAIGLNTVSASQATTMATLTIGEIFPVVPYYPRFRVAVGATFVVSDSALNLLANPTGTALATAVTATGANIVAAADATTLSLLTGFSLAFGASLVVADTALNLLASANAAGEAIATSVTLTGNANTVSSADANRLAGLKNVVRAPDANLIVSDNAQTLLSDSSMPGLAIATGTQLTGTANTVTATQAAGLAALAGFTIGSGATLTVSDTATNLLISNNNLGIAKATSVQLTGTSNADTAAQVAVLAALAGFSVAPGATLVASDTAANLLLSSNAAGIAKATSVQLIGTPNIVTAAQAAALVALTGFTVGSGATLVVADTAANLLLPSNAAWITRATSIQLTGTSNTVSAAQVAALAILPNISPVAGATVVLRDTTANLLSISAAALGLATSISATDIANTTQQVTIGGQYTIGTGFTGLTNLSATPVTIVGGTWNGQLIIAGQGGLAFNAGTGVGTVIASGGNNLISVYPGAGTQNISTGAGNDTIAVLFGANTISAGTGQNLILAQGGNDLIDSSGVDLIDVPDGNSTIDAGRNAPTVFLGTGNSLFNGGAGNATVVVGSGAATVNSSAAGQLWMQGGGGVVNSGLVGGSDTIIGGTGASTVNANAGSDFVFAGNGPLMFVGGSGASTILGSSSGSSSVFGGNGPLIDVAYGSTTFKGGAGAATVGTFGGSVTLFGGAGRGVYLGGPGGNNRMTGGAGDATMIGGGQGDILTAGSSASDVLQAGIGAETLSAAKATGFDRFYGGPGPDSIVLGDGGNQVLTGSGNATITGGAGADLIAFLSGNKSQVLIQNFVPGTDFISLIGFTNGQVSLALSNSQIIAGSEIIKLSDGTQMQFLGVNSLTTTNFLS